jgi:hypothetical protein
VFTAEYATNWPIEADLSGSEDGKRDGGHAAIGILVPQWRFPMSGRACNSLLLPVIMLSMIANIMRKPKYWAITGVVTAPRLANGI